VQIYAVLQKEVVILVVHIPMPKEIHKPILLSSISSPGILLFKAMCLLLPYPIVPIHTAQPIAGEKLPFIHIMTIAMCTQPPTILDKLLPWVTMILVDWKPVRIMPPKILRRNDMNKTPLIVLLCIVFFCGFFLCYLIQYSINLNTKTPKDLLTEYENRSIPYTSLAFKVQIVDHNHDTVGVGYIPIFKINELQSKKSEFSTSIPTVEVEMITDIPIENEFDKYFNFCLQLIPWRDDKENAVFIP
jgi:hypothetical protein